MTRVLLCCLLVLLTACASAPAQPQAGPGATATPPMMTPLPRQTATATQGSVTSGGRTCPDGLSWASCVATAEVAGTAGFVRAASGTTPGATPVMQGGTGSVEEEIALVTRVIDGRTIEVRLADGQIETVRYLGVATPEAGECYGPEAGTRNTALVGGRTVRLERDVSERDRTERLLRHVWVVGDDGALQLASEELVREGYGTAMSQPPDVKHHGRIAEAQRAASTAGRGLLGACVVPPAPSATPTVTPTPPSPPPTPTRPMPTATSAPPAPTPTRQAATATPRPPEPTPAPTATALRAQHTATPQPPAPAPPAIPTATATRVPPTATRVPTRPPPTPTPTPKAAACHPSYPTLCLPGAPDLDCADVPQKAFPVRQPDPHRFDADKDGIGCEQ